ncbi:hypothetical protein OIE50_01190 [Streptomyces canus]|uniref:hypothetical protein n=1 Tax=Streptomyces canus TaxID=58343 RepID=UPI003249498B
MLQLGSGTFDVDGVTVFRDHSDQNQFWYLATQVVLGKRPDGSPAFSLIKYHPAVADSGVKGGGFLMLQTAVALPEATRRKILGRLAETVQDGEPRLTAVPVEKGTVRCLALNLEGAGGTVAQPPPPGAFNAVEQILGATRPSLTGEETAAFSLVLNQEGATIMQQAFEQGATPVGVIYDLEYSALTPDLRVVIHADLERIYHFFSAGLEAQLYWVKAGIDAGFEKLRQDGAITIEVTDFTGEADNEAKEKWALDFFKTDLLKTWFEPSLDLGQLKGEGVDALTERLKKQNQGASAPGSPAAGAANPLQPAPATLTTTQTTPAPLPGGLGLSLLPGATGTGQNLHVLGPPGAVLTVDGLARPLDASGNVLVPVPPGTSHPVTVDWPVVAPLPAVSIKATLARPAAPATPIAPGLQPPVPGAQLPTPGGQPAHPPVPGQPAAGIPAPPAAGGMPALVSFRLRFIEQEERKTLTLVYDRKTTVTRAYAPQGFVGLLLKDLPDKAAHFAEIDLDDQFFRTLGVDIETAADFEKIGLFSTDVSIEYGRPTDVQGHETTQFQLTPQSPGPKHFETFLNASHDLDFQVGIQHHFDASSGWTGEKLSYELPPRRTLDRTLHVDPADDLGFLELQIFPHRIDEGIVDAIDVELTYDDEASFQGREVFRVIPKGSPQLWRLRLTRPERRGWTARFTHHLKNGTVLTSGPVHGDASFLPVDDPFVAALDILAVPLFAPDAVQVAFLDIDYEDAANSYSRQERLEIPGTTTKPVPLRIALLDGTRKTFRQRVTLVMNGAKLTQLAPVDSEETIIGLGAAP